MFSLREITRAGNITLRTRIAVHAVWAVLRLAENRETGFQHQVSATPVPEKCEAPQCSESY
jgi:hypothetical protein